MLGLAASPLPAIAGGEGTIYINITDIQPQKGGSLVVLLYDKKNWLKPEQAVRNLEFPLSGRSTLEVDLSGIPYPATYAVQLFQDVNKNGKMDMRWLPYPHPSEPYGFSNNYKPFAKPFFRRASFLLNNEAATLKIKMRN